MAKIKILLVDDEDSFRELMKVRLNQWGYDVDLAVNGKAALEALKKDNHDVVILDYMMPQMDGVATLKEIRKNDADKPVIMFTALNEVSVMKGAQNLGVSAFVPKLSAYADVHEALKTAIDMAIKKPKNK